MISTLTVFPPALVGPFVFVPLSIENILHTPNTFLHKIENHDENLDSSQLRNVTKNSKIGIENIEFRAESLRMFL